MKRIADKRRLVLAVGAVVLLAGGLGVWLALGRSERGDAAVSVTDRPDSQGSVPAVTPADGSPDGDPGEPQDDGLGGESVIHDPAARAAAVAAYKQGLRCVVYARRVKKLKGHELLLEHPEYTTRDPAAVLEEMERDLGYIEMHGPACQGREGLLSDGSMYEITLRAALAGDRDAMNCYASAPFEIPDSLDTDAMAAAKFRRHAIAFIESGIRAGDWKAVLLNQIRHDPHNGHLPFSQWVSLWFKQFKHEDFETTYTHIQLRYLGAQAAGTPDVEHLLRLAAHYQESLTADQIASAEKRAAELYHRYFSQAEKYPGKGGFCNF